MKRKNLLLAFVFAALLIALLFSTQVASSSVNTTASYDPQVDCLGVKMMVPPLVVFERIKMDMELGDVSNLIAKFAKPTDWAAVNIGENNDVKNVSIVWKWYVSYTDYEDRTGESAELKVHVVNYRVSAVELEQIILTRDGVERRSREKATMQYIMDRANKK